MISFHYSVFSAFDVLVGKMIDYCLVGWSSLQSFRGYSNAVVATAGIRFESTLPAQRWRSIPKGDHSQQDIRMS